MTDNLAINPRTLSLSNWMGDIQVFGDLRQVDRTSAIQYYHMNSYQKRTFIWLLENHMSELEKWFVFDSKKCRSLITIGRSGFIKTTQLIVIQAALVSYHGITAKVLENRHIALGKKGGRVLINPARRGTHIHGSYVLKALPNFSLLEPKF